MSGGGAAADIDSDGHLDLIVSRVDKAPIYYRNNGDGTFEDRSSASGIDSISDLIGTSGVAVADIDNNGCPDVYLTRVRKASHSLLINNCRGGFSEEAVQRGATPVDPIALVFGQGVAFGDYDHDGYADIFVAEWRFRAVGTASPSQNRLYRNRGAKSPGTFTDETERAGISFEGRSPLAGHAGIFGFAPAFVDLDQDGWQDLAVASDFGSSGLWWNNRNGTFTEGAKASGTGTDENGMGSTFGDYDGDGKIDWFVTSIYDECAHDECLHMFGITGNRLYRNTGNRSFTDWTDRANVRDGAWGWGATFFDYDNDGDLDIAHTSGFHVDNEPAYDKFRTDPTFLQVNDGEGRYTDRAQEAGIRDTVEGRGLLAADFDNDGDLDLFIVQRRDQPRLLRNDGGNKSDWLKIRLEGRGSQSTRDAIGAVVRVTPETGAKQQVKEVGSRDNYLGHDPFEVHYGLGKQNGSVAEVRVTWPAGCEQVVNDVAPNTTLVLAEPSC